MFLIIFSWLPRTKKCGEPRYSFDTYPSWTYVRKYEVDSFEEQRVINTINKLSETIHTPKFRVVGITKGKKGFAFVRKYSK